MSFTLCTKYQEFFGFFNGFKTGYKGYPGMIEKLKGRKLGKSRIMIPVENSKEVLVLIKKYEVNTRTLEIYAYSERQMSFPNKSTTEWGKTKVVDYS